MLKAIIFASVFCLCRGSSYDGFQSWVSDPRYELFPTLPIAAPESEDDACRRHSQLLINNLKNKTLWAMEMWDSSAKTPIGVLTGGIFQFGNFDECLKIMAPFDVQFCMTQVSAKVTSVIVEYPIPKGSYWNTWKYIEDSKLDPIKVPRDVLTWGLCLPASCSTSDMEKAIDSHLKSYNNDFNNETTFSVNINKEFCTRSDFRIKVTLGEIIFWAFLLVLIVLGITSTIVDMISNNSKKKHSLIYKTWMVFSIKRNYSKLIPLEPRTQTSMDIFHGMKFASIIFVVYGHRVGQTLSMSVLNFDTIEKVFLPQNKMLFVHTDLIVDTFFFVSGYLGCYIILNILSRKFINPLFVILHRIIRLSPLYFLAIWYQATVAFRLGSGPLWNALAKNETAYCQKNWWTNVLYINNYVKTDELCMQHSWFLPCELQFFILSVILTSVIIKNRKIGTVLLGVAIVVSAIIPAVTIYFTKVQPLVLFYYDFVSQPRLNESFRLLYMPSHNRASVYLIGMTVGVFLYCKRDSKKQLSWRTTLCGCLLWLAFMFAPMAYGSLYYDSHRPHNELESAIFASLRRISWAIGFTFFTLSHRFGKIPILDFIFSNRIALFFSRITYGIYLVHFSLITVDVFSRRTPVVFSVIDIIVDGGADVVKAACVSFVLVLILEIPLKRLLREIIFAKRVDEFEKEAGLQKVINVRL